MTPAAQKSLIVVCPHCRQAVARIIGAALDSPALLAAQMLEHVKGPAAAHITWDCPVAARKRAQLAREQEINYAVQKTAAMATIFGPVPLTPFDDRPTMPVGKC